MKKWCNLSFVMMAGAILLCGATPGSGASAPSRGKKTDKAFNRGAEDSLEAQAQRMESQVHIQNGYRFLRDGKYDQARREVTLALRAAPNNPDAKRLQQKIDELLGKRPLGEAAIDEMKKLSKVQLDIQLSEIENAVRQAKEKYYTARKMNISGQPSLEQREKMLAAKKTMLYAALDNITRAQQAIAWLPTEIDYSGRSDVGNIYTSIKKEIDRVEFALNDVVRQKVLYSANANTQEAAMRQNQRIALLMERLKTLYNQFDYKGAEETANTILTEDPLNEEARKWRDKAASASLEKMRKELQYERNFSIREVIQDLDRARIPYTDLVTYPREWDQIMARTGEGTALSGGEGQETWKRKIRDKLKKQVTFEFVDQPFREAIDFLATLGQVNIIIDPQVLQGEDGPLINLRVEDMSLELALKWVLRMAEFDMDFRNNAIFISTADNLDAEGKRLELRIYDVQDITMQTKHFIAPELTLGEDNNNGASTPWEDTGGEIVTPEVLTEFIQANIAPESWDLDGALIQESNGRIIVANKKHVHELINKFLSDFRNTQKLLVNIEARFLQLREADYTEVGVEWTGLNPFEQYWDGKALVGDFGDMSDVHSSYTWQNRTQGNNVQVPGPTDIPMPGLRTDPRPMAFPGSNTQDPTNNKAYALIGSMVNSRIGRASNINAASLALSSLENTTTRQVTGSGFHGQITFMDGIMSQAIIRAVMAKENTSLLFAPRLTVRNGQRAYVFVARQFHYVRDYEISGEMFDPVIGELFSGIILDVRPIVSYDRRYITLDLRPTVSQTTLPRQLPLNSVVFDDTGAPMGLNTVQLELPSITMQKVRASVTIPDGGVVFVGGLYSDIRFKAENGIPIVSDLPIVGRMFRWDVEENMRMNTAIMVSGQIIMFDDYKGTK